MLRATILAIWHGKRNRLLFNGKNPHGNTFGTAEPDFWNGRPKVLDSPEQMLSKARRVAIQNPWEMIQKMDRLPEKSIHII